MMLMAGTFIAGIFMHFRHHGELYLLLAALVFPLSSGASNHVVTIKGGELHLRGTLAEGACEVSPESQDMYIDMGKYRSDMFRGAGSLSAVQIPFEIHLTGCNPALTGAVDVSFYGITDPMAPDVFRVSSGDESSANVSGSDGHSGLGLLITDEMGHQVVPDEAADVPVPVTASDVVMHFTARYRATLREPSPGALRSEVTFRLFYP